MLLRSIRSSLILILFVSQGIAQPIVRSEYYAEMPFWESPVVAFRGAYPLTVERAAQRINLKLDYDEHNRVVQASVRIGDKLKPFEGRFGNLYINAPRTTVTYDKNKERHQFYDILGNRITVLNDVYEKLYVKDEHSRNISLKFLDQDGNPASDYYGNRKFEWNYRTDGSVVERRTDAEGNITPLRGEFQFMLTRITYGSDGQVNMLQNINEDGSLVNAPCGASTLKYFYDSQGRFLRWEVYDKEGNPAIGPSNTAGEYNVFDGIGLSSIVFFGKEGRPATHWSGAERWAYKRDAFGNILELAFLDADGNLKLGNRGYAGIQFVWGKQGRFLQSQTYIGADGKAMNHSELGVATTKYVHSSKGLVTEVTYLDASGRIVARKDNQVARIRHSYHDNGVLDQTTHFDLNNKAITQ